MQKKHIAAVFTGVGCLMLIVHAHAIVALGSAVAIYVVNSADDSRHDGCDQAHCNLREAIEAALQARSEEFVADIFAQLRDVSVAARANKPIGDRMIVNAAFLVARDKETAFDAKVKSIASHFDKLTFKYTGPWPPYNFVNIRLKLERA